MSRLRVLFAPDYRSGNPYQSLLAESLSRYGVEVQFLTTYRRGLPLFRGSREKSFDILHIHWPESYFRQAKDGLNWLRTLRYPVDLWVSASRTPVVITAHNLLPHNRSNERGVVRNVRFTAQQSKAIFVHSDTARQQIMYSFKVHKERVHVIPFGDHAATLGKPLPREAARAALQLPMDTKLCLMFGTVSPYKGTDEIIRFWANARLPYRLVVVGPVVSDSYAERLRILAQDCPTICLRLTREWLDNETLRAWLSASDCVIFNYQEIFSSGGASLARSFGIPLLIPRRLATIDLHEPHPHVFRFNSIEDDFRSTLERAISTPSDYELAGPWRKATDWGRIAEMTAAIYSNVRQPGRAALVRKLSA